MRSLLVFALAIVALLMVSSLAVGDVWLSDYHGYDYTWPLPENYTDPGQYYAAIGPVISMNEDFFILDEDLNEYTMRIHSGTLSDVDTVGTYIFYYYEEGDGEISFYEDSRQTGTQADFGTYPPNDTAPSTFVDGTHMFGGYFTSFRLVFEMEDGDGTLSGTINFDRGEYLENIPANMRNGWTFAGLGVGHPPQVPEGYMNQIDGEVYLEEAVPTERTTWGRIRGSYR